tara:strand:- start:45614 stop:46690 length:1077 start_codon:yes stop_codon:yes gene_type:complete
MSLSLLQETIPIQYELCQPGDGAVYHPELCTPPRIYREDFFNNNAVEGFWYDANKDRYVMTVAMAYSLWPSWRWNKYEIHPETGLVTTSILGGVNPGNGISNYENGEFGKVYAVATSGAFQSVIELDPDSLVSAGTVMDENDIPSAAIGKFLINRQDKILVNAGTVITSVYDYNLNTTLGQISMPALTISDLAYEDNERGWAVMDGQDGVSTLVKFNYKSIKVEAITALQPGSAPDFQTLIAYDSKRKVLAIFRQRDPATDGAAQHVLGLYKPFAVATNLTQPIPMSKPQPGQVVTMVAHLHGDRGEVGQLKPVTVTNSGDGTILQPTVTPRTNGAVVFQYLPGANPGSDVITLQADI